MMAWLRRLMHRPEPIVVDDAAHKATLRRADRLLRIVEAYRAADAQRKHH